jgi:hypothetical protein
MSPRSRRTKVEIQQLQHQMIEVLEADNPQSVRHMFYRMTDPRLQESVPKDEKLGYGPVQRQLSAMRKSGLLPYEWIVDHGRSGYFTTTYGGIAEAVQSISRFYRRNIWEDTPCYVEAWCESRSIGGVIRGVCEDFALPLYVSSGFSSLSLIFESALHIKHEARDRPVHILYIGDWDPAGVLIDRDIEAKLRNHLPSHDITFHRLAITAEQIALLGLPTKPPKPGDRRGGFTGGTVEAEAMPAGILRETLRKKIETFIPEGHLTTLEIAEESERDYLSSIADALRSGEL